MSILRSFVVLLTLLAQQTIADEWPQWMGPQRDSIWRESGIVDSFPEDGPRVLWRMPIGGGYAGPAVANGKVYVTDYQKRSGEITNDPGTRTELQGDERVICLDAASGKVLWEHAYNCPYKISYPVGPRTTPTVDGDRVYTLGAEGHLLCLDANRGAVVWSHALQEEYDTEAPIWGFCGHPLVHGDKLICLVGGQGSVAVAFDKNSGQELWRAISASQSGYCPPSLIEAGGTQQLIIWDADKMNGLDPETGEVHWSVPLKPNYGMSITAPRHQGNYLFASGIGHVAAVVELAKDKPAAEIIWQAGDPKESVYCSNSTPFVDGDTIYGVDCHQGSLMAVDLKSGARLWSVFAPTTGERRAAHGTAFLVKQGDRFFLFSETGDLVIAKLNRQRYEEVSRAHLLEPTSEAFGRAVVWSHPAFAYQNVYARNDEELVCVSLAK
jgi:outer membrane protein assembly factor BamB